MTRRWIWVLVLFLFAVGCPGQRPPVVVAPKTQPKRAKPAEHVVWRMSKSGLGFRLSDAEPEPAPRPKAAAAKALAAEDAKKMMARLPPLKAKARRTTFAMREKSLPAPRPGETIKTAFPPAVAAAAPPKAPGDRALSVLRWAPEGELEVAPSLSITFSQPMVPLTAIHDLAQEAVPARLAPQPPGKWRWIGTQTLLFEPDGERFPMATEYRVDVPAGTRAQSGAALAETKSFKFATPELRVLEAHPWGGPTDLEPVLFLRLNQRIDRRALLAFLSLKAGTETRKIRLASEDEIEAAADVRGRTRGVEPDRWIALKAVEPLPKASPIALELSAGATGAEGPRKTSKPYKLSFSTYYPLALEEVRCSWYDSCPPLAPWLVELNNPIDAKRFDRSMVKVEPAIADMKLDVTGRVISIQGRSKGRTKYTITLAPELADTFGQTLGKSVTGSVQVGEAAPYLFPEQDEMVVLDPAFEPRLSVYSVNRASLKVRLYAVTPRDWSLYTRFRRDWDWEGKLTEPPGKLVSTRVVRPKAARDELVETTIDLGPALKNGFGQVIAIVEPPAQPKKDRWRWQREWVRTWVQVTKMGLAAFVDRDDAWAWATNLGDGAPLANVDVSVLPGGSARTRADGIAKLALGPVGDLIQAKRGDDLVFLTGARDGGSFVARPDTEALRWLVFDDRGLYKPGERVHAKGYIRQLTSGKNGDLRRLSGRGKQIVDFVVFDPRANEIARGESELDADGGFHLGFDLAKNTNLGQARLQLSLRGAPPEWREFAHYFQIDEFRRPEFEVTAETTTGPHFVGKHAIATVRASYYAGGGLGESKVTWTARAEDAYYSPPNRAGWHFGKPRRWVWWDDEQADRPAMETWPAKTGPGGEHRLRIDFDALDPAYPRQISLESSVEDVNRQSWTARAKLLVHPANVTVGLRSESHFVSAGQNLTLGVLVTDIDGKISAGRSVNVKSARIETTWRGNEHEEKEVEIESCTLTSGEQPASCTLPTHHGGLHRITAIVTDEHGRKSQTQIDLWVLGDDPPLNPELARGKVELVPDKTEYRTGETAELVLIAPFAPAEGVLTLRREGVVELRRFRLEKRSDTLKVRIDPTWLPNVTARVDVVGSVARENERGDPDPSLPKRPAFASGSTELKVPPTDRSLKIGILPERRHVEPGAKTRIGLSIKDANDQPVAGATLALVVVDESVLALAGYELPDPLEVFYPPRSEGVSDFEARLMVALARPDTARMQLPAKQSIGAARDGGSKRKYYDYADGGGSAGFAAEEKPMVRGGHVTRADATASAPARPAPAPKPAERQADKKEGKNKEEPAKPIAVRSDFAALASFVPRIVSDGAGRAQVAVKLPESLTRYRVMVVAAAGDNRFGSAESAVTARLPLMVRPSAPRFLNFGDRFSLPVVVQNQTTRALTVDVAARGDNLELSEPRAVRVTVPASDRVELRFPASAGVPGSARFQVAAASGKLADASEDELPIWTPATTEAFATYGQVDHGAVGQKIRMPSRVFTEFGDLELTTSSTQLQGLTDALIYLVRYPFECNEQLASRILAIAALKDVLAAFHAEELPSPRELSAFVKQDVEKLKARQHYNGGWHWWRKDLEPAPFVSVHVAHALIRAREKKLAVADQTINNALSYLKNIRFHMPSWYDRETRRVIESYAIYVRWRASDSDPGAAHRLLAEAGGADKLPLDALGWLLPVLSKAPGMDADVTAIRRHLDNRVAETAGKAHFVTAPYEQGEHLLLASDRRTDGIVLEAMIGDRPESDLIPKVVAGLLAHKKRGRWKSTQENVFILLALDRYFHQYEKATPDFVARAWLGQGLAAEHTFRGRSIDRQHVDVPLAWLAKQKQPLDLVIAKDGTGRLYYRVGMQYAPSDLRPPPTEQGFSVSRIYEPVDAPGDVRRDRDGTWRVKAGALVRVRVKMVAPARRYHVALVDPLPAGFEPQNPALATTATIPRDPKQAQSRLPWWWQSTWYEHQNMRDERVEAFASLLWEGVYDYTYIARATTPGEFVVPPPKAEEMYDPETFGRGSGDRVIVE